MRAFRLLAWVAACAALSGCAHLWPSPDHAHSAVAVLPHEYLESVEIDGRFSAQFQRSAKADSWNGNFSWIQTPQLTTVSLQSPLGQTVATIAISDGKAVLTQSGQPVRSASDVDKLVADALGWPMPVSNLRDWLQAYAVTADGTRVRATPELRDAITTRDGWRIRYSSWQEQGFADIQDVPRRIDMARDTVEAGLVQIRVVIGSWQPL
jgi:outer membrane lipoprotein LolB